MVTQTADLKINVVADTNQAARELNKTSGLVKGIGGGLVTGLKTVAVAGAAAGAAIGAVGVLTANFASDAAESRNKVRVVFSRMSGDIEKWAEDAATAFGMSEQMALEAAGTFGNLFSAMGLAEPVGADMSKSLVELAADLASFNNIDPAVALEKLRAGIVGEAEPLRTLGVNISEARTKQKALEMGLYDGVGALSAAAKAQANFALITEDTTKAQGDFARTSDGMANQQRTLAAVFADTMADIGAAFVPIIEKILPQLVEMLKGLAAWVTSNGPAIGDALGVVAALIGEAFDFLTNEVLPRLIAGFEYFVANILPGIIDALGWLATNVVPVLIGVFEFLAAKVMPKLVDLFDFFVAEILPALIEAFDAVAAWVSENWPLISSTVLAAIDAIVAVIKFAWPIIEAIARILFPIIGVAATALFTVLGRTFSGIALVITALTPIVKTVVDAVVGFFDFLYRMIDRIFGQTRTPIEQFVDFLGGVWDGIADMLTAPFEAAEDVIRNVMRTLTGIVRGAVGIIEGIIDGLTGAFDAVAGVVDALPGGRAAPAAMAVVPTVAVPSARGVGAAPMAVSPASRLRPAELKMTATVTHRIDDPGGALANVPGGAAAIASMLNRGADASGLYRNLQHAAGIA